MQKVKKAVIPAGGRGTRFLPITKALPKELLPIIDRPVLDYIIDEAIEAGVEEILIITGAGKECIPRYYAHDETLIAALEQSGKPEFADIVREVSGRAKISFALQKEPLGSGDAILHAESFAAGEPFALLLGDDVVVNDGLPAIKQLIIAYEECGKTILGVQERLTDDIVKYGVIDIAESRGRLHKMNGILEKPALHELTSRLCTLGRYVVAPEIFEVLRRTPLGKGNELQLTDGLNLLCKEQGSYAYEFEGRRYDLGDKLGAAEAGVEFALRRDDIGADFKTYLKRLVETL